MCLFFDLRAGSGAEPKADAGGRGPSAVGAQIDVKRRAAKAPASVKTVSALEDHARLTSEEHGRTPHEEVLIAMRKEIGVSRHILESCELGEWAGHPWRKTRISGTSKEGAGQLPAWAGPLAIRCCRCVTLLGCAL